MIIQTFIAGLCGIGVDEFEYYTGISEIERQLGNAAVKYIESFKTHTIDDTIYFSEDTQFAEVWNTMLDLAKV